MAPPIGIASFPGIERVISCSATLAHGITPGIFSLVIAPQGAPIAEGGPLILAFDHVRIIFGDCRIDSGSVTRNASGQIVSLSVLDRRWKWTECGEISGSYNLRNDDATIIAGTERTPQDLAAMCLVAMGEFYFDVTALPNESRPTVEWDLANPAQALADLCEDLGCRVVPQTRGGIAICRVGVGAPLPRGPLTQFTAAIDPPERPDAITVVTGRSRFQCEFALEAVGLDEDGSIRPLDKLRYAAGIDWGNVDLVQFEEVASRHGRRAQELANLSVYRWYRIVMPAEVPGFGRIEQMDCILPLEREQVDTLLVEGRKVNKPAEVTGTWFRGNDGRFENVQMVVDRPFAIDTLAGIVKFSEPIFAWKNLKFSEPNLKLKVAVSIKDLHTRAWHRYRRRRVLGGQMYGTQDRYIRHDAIAINFSNGMPLNQAEINAECDYYLDAIESTYRVADPVSASYAGLIPVELDGAIQSITWRVGGGAFTTIQRNQDLGSPTTIPFKNRRAAERKRSIEQTRKQLAPQQLRKTMDKARVL